MITNIAHRGARSIAPENTLLAAQRAYEIGAELWETDVAVTADHHLVLMHDPQLTRTTDVAQVFPDRKKLPLHHFTLAEIRRLNAGNWFIHQDPFGQIAADRLTSAQIEACRKERVPTVKEALVFTKARHWKINLELKQLPPEMRDFPMVTKVLGLIDQVGMSDGQVIISSFDHNWLREIRIRRPAMPIQALLGDTGEQRLNWGNFEFDIYNVNHGLIDDFQIETARRNGKKLNVFTVNEIADMKFYIEKGVAGLFTDFPQRLNDLLNRV